MIPPGATLGLLGGGQLGRMFTVAARTLGYRVTVLDPDPDAPAAEFATAHLAAPFSDPAALEELARSCAAVTTEFENAPAGALEAIGRRTVVRPSGPSVAVAQDRRREKDFFAGHGFALGAWAAVESPADFEAALRRVRLPALLKTARLGYDGKGQARIDAPDELARAFAGWGGVPCVLEELLALELEVSVVLARTEAGEIAAFPAAENHHGGGILDLSIAPARVDEALAREAEALAARLAAALGYVGVLAVEMFVVGGRLLVNEIAPRPHNSGHYTLDACRTSQFEQQVRVLCGLPLGDPSQHTPAVMVNLLGDIWRGGAPDWAAVLRHPGAHLHLYGKREARPGRKMGHVTVCDLRPERALEVALAIRRDLGIGVDGASAGARGTVQGTTIPRRSA
ncbi:MAG TPA: 5-(carboxyamino)imidazole ribonucleotide synthase [Myxococcota bacterium]|nr:5-(carboxyamino)imidazole ribonucleotide synthase [Myxococcota bacterium]